MLFYFFAFSLFLFLPVMGVILEHLKYHCQVTFGPVLEGLFFFDERCNFIKLMDSDQLETERNACSGTIVKKREKNMGEKEPMK